MPAVPIDATLHIGEIAERVGLSLRTVRYYEEQGLVQPAGRTEGGFRLYTQAQVDRLLLIKQMKPLGFTVQEMGELLTAYEDVSADDAAVRRAARQRIAEFARDARARCAQLRETLVRAEEFARRLGDLAPERPPETPGS